MSKKVWFRKVAVALVASVFAAALYGQSPARPPNPAYVRIADLPDLPRVLLIGDSISAGYTIPARRLLEEKVNLHRIPENGGPTTRGLEKIGAWLGKGAWDVIHFNWGLHDLKIMEDGKQQVPIDQYEQNLRRLVERLGQTGARLIWASTTPVPEGDVRPKRSNGDVVSYNKVARRIMDEHGVRINDLYSFAMPILDEIQRPVNVHFTEEGSRRLAERVAASISAEIHAAPRKPDTVVDYLEVVRAYADAMITYGRDRYGNRLSPLFAAALDRYRLRLPEKAPPAVPGIRKNDRTLTGANPMHSQNLYQVLYALSKVTGEERYAVEADQALLWFLKNCQSPATHLYAWGEHLGWDFHTEGPLPGRDIHEFYRPWVLTNRSFELAPDSFQEFALGLWRHQIADQQTGEFSRHAKYSEHGPNKGREFPRHGGFYIATWAAAYGSSSDNVFTEAIDTLVSAFEHNRNPTSGALPSQNAIPDLAWPQSAVSLAIDLWEAAKKVPEDLATKMRRCARRTDDVFLSIDHDLSPAGKGFIKSALTETLESGDPRGKSYPYTRIWATGYGEATDANIAMHCVLRYQQIQEEGYKRLFLAAAERYLHSDPDTSIALYPGAAAEAIAVMLGAYRLTGSPKYLDRAEHFGEAAVRIFFPGSPLPRASSAHDHYEAITRGDTLAMELLDLWAAKNRADLSLDLVWNER